ncbi:MAG: extracellular solute-binding protein [Lachnospiraceae bacterium]|nr:extracellular solute-binding protein [Lachnospiraceae bacterium]
MKKRITRLFAFAMALVMVVALAACGKKKDETDNGGKTDLNALAGDYNIVVWVSESAGVTDLTDTQIKRFCEENPGININARIEGITEAESASQMITSVEDGADLYCFAQDQLVRLVQAGALAKLGEATQKTVTELNDKTSVQAATVGDVMYCYPLTSDNGYYMYYDKSVIPAEHLDSLEDIIADCEKAGKMFSMELTTSAWYNAAFFFATGCVSEWQIGNDGQFTGVNDTFNSDNGVIALKGMQKLLKSPSFNSSSAGADFAAAVPSAVVVSGTWASSAVKEALGENYAATDLPSFTVDGKSYHLGSFSGCKLIGVKPQTDAKKAAVLQQLALYLSNEKCQLERFDLVGWGPSNLGAQKNDAVQSDIALAALAKQAEYAIPQGQIHGSWWDIAKVYAVSAQTATTDAELKAALQTYQDTINGLFAMSVDEKEAWSVIGSMNGDGWANDIPMVCDSQGVWHSDVINFKAGDEFKARQGKSWDVNIGSDGALNGPNFTITEDGPGFVKFTFDKASTTGTLTIEKTSDIYGFTIIGSINGDGWSIDLPMEIQADGSWLTTEAYNLNAGDEFKARQGKNWDVNYGVNGENYKVETAGTYFIKLTADKTIELIAK